MLKAENPKYQVVTEDDIGMFETPNGTFIVKTVVLKLLRYYEVEQVGKAK